MRKKILLLGSLTLGVSIYAQTTYVGNGAKVYVEKGALVYSGGDWSLDSNTEKSVENKGQIVIVGDYKKGSNIASTEGKEFVNVYTGLNDYGQVKILSSQGTTDARMTVERPAASSNYFGASFPISFPYKDAVKYLMLSFNKQENDFRGDCPKDASCGDRRYGMSLFKWNNDKLQPDAVVTTDNFGAGDYYTLNLRDGAGLKDVMTGTIGYKGTPNPTTYTKTAKGVIAGTNEATFSNLGYNDWKNKTNPYNERYKSYLGDVNTTSKTYAKNTYRFGNPYTSNLDISAVEGANSWLTITNNNTRKNIKEATGTLIQDFTITKRIADYNIDWNSATGTTNVNASYYSAKYDGTNWVGSPEALIIRPTETFNLNFKKINPAGLGNTRIVSVEVAFKDGNKTFAYPGTEVSTTITPKNSSLGISSSSLRTLSRENKTLGLSNSNNFYQAEIFLVANDNVVSAPVYLVGTGYSKETSASAKANNDIFLYGMNNGEPVVSSEKVINEFNSNEYVGKPLALGFSNLKAGSAYELRFNLYEGSIFNKTKNTLGGSFYILDNKNNTVNKIEADKSFKFVADADMTGRFDIYWKEVPATSSLATTENVSKASSTVVYKDGRASKVRFEQLSKHADVQVYDISGKLVVNEAKVDTSADYRLDLLVPGAYVVKVTYANGVVRTVKTVF